MPRTKRRVPTPNREPRIGQYCEPRPGEVKGMIWGLRDCPCCGAPPDVSYSSGVDEYCTIACSKRGCKIVAAVKDTDAAKIWNTRRFTDK